MGCSTARSTGKKASIYEWVAPEDVELRCTDFRAEKSIELAPAGLKLRARSFKIIAPTCEAYIGRDLDGKWWLDLCDGSWFLNRDSVVATRVK